MYARCHCSVRGGCFKNSKYYLFIFLKLFFRLLRFTPIPLSVHLYVSMYVLRFCSFPPARQDVSVPAPTLFLNVVFSVLDYSKGFPKDFCSIKIFSIASPKQTFNRIRSSSSIHVTLSTIRCRLEHRKSGQTFSPRTFTRVNHKPILLQHELSKNKQTKIMRIFFYDHLLRPTFSWLVIIRIHKCQEKLRLNHCQSCTYSQSTLLL